MFKRKQRSLLDQPPKWVRGTLKLLGEFLPIEAEDSQPVFLHENLTSARSIGLSVFTCTCKLEQRSVIIPFLWGEFVLTFIWWKVQIVAIDFEGSVREYVKYTDDVSSEELLRRIKQFNATEFADINRPTQGRSTSTS